MGTQNFKMSNLKKIREKNNLTQVRLSIEVEVSQELISQYELGKSKPNIDNLLKLANFFNCSTDYLLQRTNNPSPVTDIDKLKNADINNIIEKYYFLSPKNKEHFNCFLDYLTNYKK